MRRVYEVNTSRARISVLGCFSVSQGFRIWFVPVRSVTIYHLRLNHLEEKEDRDSARSSTPAKSVCVSTSEVKAIETVVSEETRPLNRA